ncbi:M16 family metallopeptidase [Aquisalinus flavus]|uniref:Zinc protease n=1 Tax=Aquisalinus flavus TaxID=1526572 RepID=A0A8J2V266_9PROT|nr:pitrilysin family protein [Aquisalinus flavus]MBD0425429.1 insulinase family protein [Aquisalinus flavus]UNE48930.1 insulinase family protein [Aquisalinus flavus]GGD16141.1 zinc protease [Aquisalinus flavus]
MKNIPLRGPVRGLLAAAAASVVAALPAFAQTEVELDYEQFILDNGLTVVVHEDRKAPVVAIQVMYGVGSKDEPAGKTGFAHLFEHLMFNGSENFDKDFFFALKEMGATQYNGTTNTDRTNYYQTVPVGALEQILFLESDRMGHLLGAVTQEKLDNQIGVVQNEKRQREGAPYGTVFEKIFAGVYPADHPYHHSVIGSMEDLEAASLEDVKQWFRDYYGAANAVLVLAGDIDAAEARPLVEKYFGDIEAGPPLTKPEVNEVRMDRIKRVTMVDRVAKPRVYRVWPAPRTGTAESPVLDLMTRAVGSGKTSRLYRELVDERQLANGVSMFYYEQLLSGLVILSVDAKSEEDLDEINDVIDAELNEFLRKGPTADELDRAKTIYASGEIRGLEEVAGKASTLARGALFLGDPDFYVEENLDRLMAASPEEVLDVSRRWITPAYFELTVLPYPDYSTSAGVDRSAGLPPIGAPGEVSFPEITTSTLSNGIEVVIAPRPTVPVVQLALRFDAGSASDMVVLPGNETGLPGISAGVMSLLDEGTENYSAQELAERKESLGAILNLYSGDDDNRIYLSALKQNLDESLDLMAEVTFNATFPAEEVEKMRKRQIDGVLQEKADGPSLAIRAIYPAVYGEDHPYTNPATIDEAIAAINAIEREDMVAWRDAWLQPGKAKLFVTGDTTAAEILPKLEATFGDWQGSGTAPDKTMPQVALPDAPRVIVIDKPASQQSVIVASILMDPTGTDQDTAIAAMNDIFGGSFLSRLNMNLREDKGWSYGVRTLAPDRVGQRPFTFYAPVQTDQTAASIAEIKAEIAAILGDEPVSQEELDRVIADQVGSLPGAFEAADTVLFSMMSNDEYGRPYDYATGRAERFQALTTDQVTATASGIIQPDRLTWVIVGDWSQIQDEVEALDLGPIEVRSTTSR